MTIKQRILWIKRAIEYSLKYYLIEYPRGLDFSKRSRDKKTFSGSSGYALTSKKALRNILRGIPISNEATFLDVGGGKGGTSVFALELGFLKAAQLEFEEYLHEKDIDETDLRTQQKDPRNGGQDPRNNNARHGKKIDQSSKRRISPFGNPSQKGTEATGKSGNT